MVTSPGATQVLDYDLQQIGDAGVIFDTIIDIGGNRNLSELRSVLAERGRLVVVGGELAGTWMGGYDRQIRAHLLSPFVGQTKGTLVSSESAADLQALATYIDQGAVGPIVDRVFPLAEAASALRYFADGEARGKVVIRVS